MFLERALKNHQAKKFEKKSKKCLTNCRKCGIIKMFQRGQQKNLLKGIGDNYGKENDYR